MLLEPEPMPTHSPTVQPMPQVVSDSSEDRQDSREADADTVPGLPDWATLLNALPATGILRAILLNTVLVELSDEHVVCWRLMSINGVFSTRRIGTKPKRYSARIWATDAVEMRLGVQRE